MMRKAKSGREMLSLLDLAKVTTEEEFLTIHKKISLDAFRDLVRLTPRDTGFAKSMWRVSINVSVPIFEKTGAPGMKYPPAQYPDKKINFGDSVHLYNNTAYIGFLNNGTSKQAAAAFIDTAFMRAKLTAERLFKSLSKRKADV